MKARSVAWLAFLACAAGLSLAGPAHAAFPGTNGNIAFFRVTTACGGTPCPKEEVWKRTPFGSVALAPGSHPAWSADGQRLAFVDGNDIYTVKPDGSDRQLVFDGNFDVIEGISWAPGGDRLAAALGVCDLDECRSDIHVIELGPSSTVVNITPGAFSERNPAWSPDGHRIAFDSVRDGNNDVYTMDVDGSNLARLTTDPASDSDPNWEPSGEALAFTAGRDSTDVVYTMNPDGTAQTRRSHPSLYPSQHPAWSPDGTRIVFSGVRGQITQPQLVVVTADGASESPLGGGQGQSDFEPDWQAANATVTYVRPRGASPLRVSLVPAYAECTTPNRTHGPPLAFGACSPPSQASPNVTVGTPDVNGAGANSTGYARLAAWESLPGGPTEADVTIEMSLSDIRCGSGTTACGSANDRAGADYIGEVRLEHEVRHTDRSALSDALTTQDFPFQVRVGCSATSSTATGAICSVLTSANAIVPGSVHELRRTIWQMGQIRVLDGGADGDAETSGDNRLFATQGIFVP